MSRVWSVGSDDLIEYRTLTSDTLDGALNVMRKSFFLHEKVCIGVELPRHPEAMVELEELCLRAAKDGVSTVAVEKKSGKVVGTAFNKLQVKPVDGQPSYFTQYAANCKHASSKALVKFMDDADSVVDLFELTQANCLFEIMFLAVLPEFRQRGIGEALFELCLKIGRALKNGENVKSNLDGESLPLEPVPTAVCAILTCSPTQHFGKRSGFTKAGEINFEEYTFEGKSFSSRIGPDPPVATVEYKFL